ncbi:hypothetical protein DMC30DRAFT_405577, partial [Rhodotorula diobovata]
MPCLLLALIASCAGGGVAPFGSSGAQTAASGRRRFLCRVAARSNGVLLDTRAAAFLEDSQSGSERPATLAWGRTLCKPGLAEPSVRSPTR